MLDEKLLLFHYLREMNENEIRIPPMKARFEARAHKVGNVILNLKKGN